MSGEDTPRPAPPGGERTVMASAEELAAAIEAQAAAAPAAAVPPATAPPAPWSDAPPPDLADLPAPQTAAPAVPSFGHGPPGGLVGYQLNDLFEIVRFIARGGMGEVYEGRNLASGERVAIKVILPQYAIDAQFMALFRREASALERLGHDALVKYRTLAFDRTSQLNYLAIEYVDGPPMSDVLDGTAADAATIRAVLARLAAGLAAAHDAGVIHRDLSPDNILLPGGDLRRAKIIDFGIAKDTNPGEKSVVGSAFAGKFGYAAPEIFGKFGREVGPWTDVYSLALVVIALARGRPLEMGITIVDALEARDSVPDLSYLPPELVPVFTAMLQPDPAARARTMPDVLALLDDGGTAARFAARPPTADAPAPGAAATPAFVRADASVPAVATPPNRTPLYAGIAAVAVLALAGGGYALFAGSSGQPDAAGDPPVATATPPDAVATASGGPAAPISAPVPALPDWALARAQVTAALRAVPCSDLTAAAPPTGRTVRVTGWRPASAAIPAVVAGFQLEAGGTASVDQPSAETCDIVARLRAAVPASDPGFAINPRQALQSGSPTKWSVRAQLDPGALPPGKPAITVFSIDDQPGSDKRIESASVPRAALRGLAFEGSGAKRYLIALAAGAAAPPTVGWPLDTARLAAACAGGGCALTTGWVTIAP